MGFGWNPFQDSFEDSRFFSINFNRLFTLTNWFLRSSLPATFYNLDLQQHTLYIFLWVRDMWCHYIKKGKEVIIKEKNISNGTVLTVFNHRTGIFKNETEIPLVLIILITIFLFRDKVSFTHIDKVEIW